MDVDMSFEGSPLMERHVIPMEPFEPFNIIPTNYKNVQCFILWNKFSIVTCPNLKFSSKTVYYSDIPIKRALSLNNTILYQDIKGNIRIDNIWKNNSMINDKLTFDTVLQNVLDVFEYFGNIYAVQREGNKFVLKQFKIDKKTLRAVKILNLESEIDYSNVKFYLQGSDYLSKCLGVGKPTDKVLFMVRDDSLYFKLFDDSEWKLMHTCPVPVFDLRFDTDRYVTIYMTLITGTVAVLTYKLQVEVYMLNFNCRIDRMVHVDNYFIYTDGDKLWQSVILEDSHGTLTERHRELPVNNVYDITYDRRENRLYCTTVNDFIYVLSRESLINFDPKMNVDDKWIPVPRSLCNSKKLIDDVLAELKEMNNSLEQIKKEETLSAVVHFSREADDMGHHFMIGCTFRDDINETGPFVDAKDYIAQDMIVMVLNCKLSEDVQDKYREFFKANCDIWHLNVVLQNYTLQKSFVRKLESENFDDVTIPIRCDFFPCNVRVDLVALVPDSHRDDVETWCVLLHKQFDVDSKYHLNLSKKRTQRFNDTLDERIVEIASKHCYSTWEIEKSDNATDELSIPRHFVRFPNDLPGMWKEFLGHLTKRCSPMSGKNLVEKLSDVAFVSQEKSLKIPVLNHDIELSIIKEGNVKKMMVSGNNRTVCWEIYQHIKECLKVTAKTQKKTVPHFDYMKLQKLHESTSSILRSGDIGKSELLKMSYEFDRDVIGILPIIT